MSGVSARPAGRRIGERFTVRAPQDVRERSQEAVDVGGGDPAHRRQPPVVRGQPLQKLFFRSVGMISVDRTSGAGTMTGLELSLKLLAEGDGVGIHIEGTRSPDGRLYKGTTGTAWLALRSEAPVVPCGLVGTERVHPKGAKRLYAASFDARFGPAMTFAEHLGRESDRRVRRAVTTSITAEISALSGQEYVDMYAETMLTSGG
ncbi:lysophospholipid acyltransferase family protein [Streptomyces sp. NPDC006700]|uniref:lysophospholipid acyltransferase family protein n=1 Tax=Streptomyces sp. NPDC006700 TaxID=3154479 RepID=UPI0033D26C4B